MKYSEVQYSLVQYSEVQWSTVKYSEVQWSTVKYSEVQSNTVKYSEGPWSTVKYCKLQWSTIFLTPHPPVLYRTTKTKIYNYFNTFQTKHKFGAIGLCYRTLKDVIVFFSSIFIGDNLLELRNHLNHISSWMKYIRLDLKIGLHLVLNQNTNSWRYFRLCHGKLGLLKENFLKVEKNKINIWLCKDTLMWSGREIEMWCLFK